MTDLSNLDVVALSNEGAEITLLHPTTGTPLDIVVTVLGRDSDKFKSIMNRNNRERIAKAQKSRKIDIDTDAIEEQSIACMAACTTGWSGMVVKGKDLPFTEDNAVMVYTKWPWVKEQIDAAINDRANFMRG